MAFAATAPASGISDELWQKCLKVEAAAVSDVLHKFGYSHREMDAPIQSASEGVGVIGIARTLSSRPIERVPDAGREYELLFASIDALDPGDVILTDRMDCCVWGELCSERALKRGSNGAVIDGYYRDARRVRLSGYPVFSRGRHLSDLLYHREIVAADEPVECGGVHVTPGDLVIGNDDGVVVIPRALVEDVIGEAYEKSRVEDVVRAELREGASTTEVYAKYGVM